MTGIIDCFWPDTVVDQPQQLLARDARYSPETEISQHLIPLGEFEDKTGAAYEFACLRGQPSG